MAGFQLGSSNEGHRDNQMTDVASLKMLYSIFTDKINAITSTMTIKMFLKNPKNTTTKKQHTNQNGYFLRQNLVKCML